jgi:hypothetical protein
MSETAPIVDALYSRFLLRDVFGKIVPGALLLFTAVHAILYRDPNFSLKTLQGIPVFIWLILLGACWIIGFAIQSFAEFFNLIFYYPHPERHRDLSDPQKRLYTAETAPSSDKEFLETLGHFREEMDKNGNQQIQQHERLVVIMEACGNGYVCLGIAALFHMIAMANIEYQQSSGFLRWIWSEACRLWPHGIIFVSAFIFLRCMHMVHVDRQWQVVRNFFKPSVPQTLSGGSFPTLNSTLSNNNC